MDREVTTMVGTEVARDLPPRCSNPSQAARPLRGSVLVLIQFDVCEEIRLDVLRNIFPRPHRRSQLQEGSRPTSATSVLRSRRRSSR